MIFIYSASSQVAQGRGDGDVRVSVDTPRIMNGYEGVFLTPKMNMT